MESILLKAKTFLFTIFAEKRQDKYFGIQRREMTRFNLRWEGGFIIQYSQHSSVTTGQELK